MNMLLSYIYISVNPDANPLHLQTIIGVKWLEVMKTDPGTCHFYKRKKLEYNKEIVSLKAQLERNKVGWLSDKLLPNEWSAGGGEDLLSISTDGHFQEQQSCFGLYQFP